MSPVERLAQLTPGQRRAVLCRLTPAQQRSFPWAWRSWWARADQLAPDGEWFVFLLLAGRGFGKSRSGAEWVRERVESGKGRRIGLIGRTGADVRKVMIEGPAGILAISAPWLRPTYEPGKQRLVWPNGAQAATYSAERPDQLRGPQHDTIWADELAAWRYPEAWDQAMFGLRHGADPRAMVTTTPRPTAIVRGLLADPTTAVRRGATYANRANLPAPFLAQLLRKYEGTRLGRQELLAELLDDVPGALWTRDLVERGRLRHGMHPTLTRVVVAIDPAATSGEDADETGLIVAGKDARGHGYVLADLSGHYAPAEWARLAISAYREHRADRVVAEVNNGGEMVEATLRVIDPDVSYRAVRATRGKAVRAEPVAALYEQGRMHHMGAFPQLEDQMVAFTTDDDERKRGQSPDRVDALVWALTDLLVAPISSEGIFDTYRRRAAQTAAEAAKAAAHPEHVAPRTAQ